MTSIDKSRWLALSPLLDESLDANPDEREQRLRTLASEAPELAAELAALLSEHKAADAAGFLQSTVSTPVSAGLAGRVFDRYTLDRQIGEGGMGSVWLAHRSDGRYEGQVAIKLLSLPLIGPAGLSERRADSRRRRVSFPVQPRLAAHRVLRGRRRG